MTPWLIALMLVATPDAGASAKASRVVVARLFGTDIYLDVLLRPSELPADRDDGKRVTPELRRELGARLRDLAIGDASRAYAKEHGLQPTKAEIERCAAGRKRTDVYPEMDKQIADLIAEGELTMFSVNKALYKEFGGRVVFSMTGFDPIDAQQKLLERYEAKKEISFARPEVREAVFEYFRAHDLRELDPPNIKILYEKPRCFE